MKVEMFDTQKSAMPPSFNNFDFLLIYKADSAGLRTYPISVSKLSLFKVTQSFQ